MNKKVLAVAAAAFLSAGITLAQSTTATTGSDTSHEPSTMNQQSNVAPMQSNTSSTGSSSPNPNHKDSNVKVTTKEQEAADSQDAKAKNNEDPARLPNTTTSRKDQSTTSGPTTGGSTSTPDYDKNPHR